MLADDINLVAYKTYGLVVYFLCLEAVLTFVAVNSFNSLSPFIPPQTNLINVFSWIIHSNKGQNKEMLRFWKEKANSIHPLLYSSLCIDLRLNEYINIYTFG